MLVSRPGKSSRSPPNRSEGEYLLQGFVLGPCCNLASERAVQSLLRCFACVPIVRLARAGCDAISFWPCIRLLFVLLFVFGLCFVAPPCALGCIGMGSCSATFASAGFQCGSLVRLRLRPVQCQPHLFLHLPWAMFLSIVLWTSPMSSNESLPFHFLVLPQVIVNLILRVYGPLGLQPGNL